MSAIKPVNTKPELKLHRALWHEGLDEFNREMTPTNQFSIKYVL
jgi:hypothetical protein